MNGRERVRKALRPRAVDRPPIDLGSTPVTGIQATTLPRRDRALGLPRRAGDDRRALPDPGRGRGARAAGARASTPSASGAGHDLRLPQRELEAVEPPRRDTGPRVRALPVHRRRERRHPHLPEGRHLGEALGAPAEGRLLLRRDHPPAADRRGPPRPRRTGPTSSASSPTRTCGTSRTARSGSTRTPTTPWWATSGRAGSGTSPSCPPRTSPSRRACATPTSGTSTWRCTQTTSTASSRCRPRSP